MTLKRRLRVLASSTDNEGVEDTGIKLAFASTDMKTVDQHFGYAKSFAIYAVNPEHCRLIEVAEYGDISGDANEDKLAEKLETLNGCVAVYTQAVGASAIRQLKTMGIQPVKVVAGAHIQDLLESVQEELQSGPATWLARAIESQRTMKPSKFDEMEIEGWHDE